MSDSKNKKEVIMCGCIKKQQFRETKKVTCPDCQGNGKNPQTKLGPIKTCPTCKGVGKIIK